MTNGPVVPDPPRRVVANTSEIDQAISTLAEKEALLLEKRAQYRAAQDRFDEAMANLSARQVRLAEANGVLDQLEQEIRNLREKLGNRLAKDGVLET